MAMTMARVEPHMLYGHRGNRETVRAAREAGEVIPLARGGYLRADLLDEFAEEPWMQENAVMLGQQASVGNMRRTETVFVGLSAAVAHGIPLKKMPEKIDITVPENTRRSRLVLPPTRRDKLWVPERTIVRHSFQLDSEEVCDADGLVGTTLKRTAVHSALHEPPETAFVAVGGIVSRLCPFDREQPRSSRQSQAELKQELLKMTGSVPGSRRARRIIAAVDTGATNVAERLLHYLVWRAGFTGVHPQLAIDTYDGRKYADLAFKELGVVAELEGKAKRSDTDGRIIEESLEAAEERRTAIEAAGWRVVYVYWKDLGRPDIVVRRIATAAQNPVTLNPVIL